MSKLKRCMRDLTGPTNPTTAGAMVVGGIGTTLILVTVGVAFYWIILGLISGAAIGGISSTYIANTIDKCRKNYLVEDLQLATKLTDIFIQRTLNIYIILKEMCQFAKANKDTIHLRQIIVDNSASIVEQNLVNNIIKLHKLNNPGYYNNKEVHDNFLLLQPTLKEFEKSRSEYIDYLSRKPKKKAMEEKAENLAGENNVDLEMQAFGTSISKNHFTFFKAMVAPSTPALFLLFDDQNLNDENCLPLRKRKDKGNINDGSTDEELNNIRDKHEVVPNLLSKNIAEAALFELKKHSLGQINYIKFKVDQKIERNQDNQRIDVLNKLTV